jgi:alpha-beta hydrolase superfamily lysophospholipase
LWAAPAGADGRLCDAAAAVGAAFCIGAEHMAKTPHPEIPPEALAIALRPVALTLPGMEAAAVTADLDYAGLPQPYRMDVYRLPGLAPHERRPAVLFIHGAVPQPASAKEMRAFKDWGRLAAASGRVGVTFSHRLGWPERRLAEGAQDLERALAYVRDHAGELNIDAERLALMAFSGGGPLLAPFYGEAPAHIRALVAIYPMLEPVTFSGGGHRPPLFLARAGADAFPGLLPAIDAFVAQALAADYPLTLANNPGAPHGFDIEAPTPRTLEVLQGVLGFLSHHLTG